MSLSALLLGASSSGKVKKNSKKAIDSDLDALFRSTAPASAPELPANSSRLAGGKKKRKSRELDEEVDGTRDVKRSKSKGEKDGPKKKKKKVRIVEDMDAAEEDNSDLEKAYTGTQASPEEIPGASVDVDESDEEGDPSKLVHESVAKTKSKRSSAKSKYVPVEETSEQRDARTIFVGNLSVEIAQKKPLLKKLQRHILAHVPSAKIESTRFRSIPFQSPTSKLPTSDDEGDSSKPAKTPGQPSSSSTSQKPTPRLHDRERTATWRADQDDTEIKGDDKKFLNPNQKKKIAFINGEFHSTADSVNAYIVFSHPAPASAVPRPANLPPLPEVMDPYDAARLAVEKCDGTLFMERMIRVDLANKGAKGSAKAIGSGIVDGNPKLSVFVGNLDFGCKEEDLRVFFEGVVSGERGPPGVDASEDEDGDKKARTWVTRVRIVRDKETQLGKGFAYVQFADRECVDEILSMEETKLKFAKRKLRVQRCKTFAAASSAPTGARLSTATDPKSLSSSSPSKPRAPAVPIPIPSIPKGDPALGGKLAHLPKDERKQIKSSNTDRIARRLAKKKARNALAREGVKALGKDRDRVRKTTAIGGKKPSAVPRKKDRIRSEKSVGKRNMKK